MVGVLGLDEAGWERQIGKVERQVDDRRLLESWNVGEEKIKN
jgi:hypothetical protein